jgi:hypothetical protein
MLVGASPMLASKSSNAAARALEAVVAPPKARMSLFP